MKIAVVILNWNGEKLLQQFLPTVIKFSNNATIYIADNASTDHSIILIEQQFPEVKIIKNKSNFGFAKGYNEALKFVNEPYFVLLNSDVEVTKNWLYTIESIFNNNNQIGIIQPKILDYKKKSHFEYAGAAGGFIDRFGFPFCRGRIFEYLEEDKGQFEAQEEIFWASGACLCIRKNIFDELGGFDTDFFAHQEEIDLCWRAFNNGYKTIYTPESVVYHIGGATLNASSPLKTYLNFRNSLFMLVKNVPTESLFWVLIFRMIQDGIAAFKFLFEGKSNHFFAVGKSHFSFYLSFYKMYKKRKKTQKSNYFKINSIVFNYYVKKNMIYKNLFNTNL